MEFTLCGPDLQCAEFERQRKAKNLPQDIGELLKRHGCFNCLDVENAANLITNITLANNWRSDVRARCGTPSR